MIFTDTQLQACFELNLSDQPATLPAELREIAALISTHAWFEKLDGLYSSRVHQTIDRLLSPDLRPGLHEWYGRPSSNVGRQAIELREQLGRSAGERLGQPAPEPLNPS